MKFKRGLVSNYMIDLKEVFRLKKNIELYKPLIHCITHPIAINLAANIVLAVGASPIMVEHPNESYHITKSSEAVSLSLGNITRDRLLAMSKSLEAIKKYSIPCILDLVGIGVSPIRYEFAKKALADSSISTIKGNMSEIKMMAGLEIDAKGVDVGPSDRIENSIDDSVDIAKRLALKYKTVVIATGSTDIITDGDRYFLIKNGHPLMGRVTATGCMLSCLVASFLAVAEPLDAALLATSIFDIAGQIACEEEIYSKVYDGILDNVYSMDEEKFMKFVNVEEL